METSKYKEIIRKHHCGYNESLANYDEIIRENPIDEPDLKYFEEKILFAAKGGQFGYDTFPDEGGIDIACILLAEIKRLRNY